MAGSLPWKPPPPLSTSRLVAVVGRIEQGCACPFGKESPFQGSLCHQERLTVRGSFGLVAVQVPMGLFRLVLLGALVAVTSGSK